MPIISSAASAAAKGYGFTSGEFRFTISSNQTNANLATLATSAGWDGATRLVATVNAGVYILASSTGTPALTVNGTFPGGVELVNNGYIVGYGGAGGYGSGIYTAVYNGGAGLGGGAGMYVRSLLTITNNGTIAGGGGGGGGGAASNYEDIYGGGGGGGGAPYGAGGVGGYGTGPGQFYAGSGGSASLSSGASGGSGNYTTGGTGGGWGTAGSAGGNGYNVHAGTTYGGSGGAAGYYMDGNSYVTWAVTGTRLGNVS